MKYNSLKEYIQDIQDFTRSFNNGGYAFFRGVNKSIYDLTPSLFRKTLSRGYTLPTLENNLFFEFISKADNMILDKNDWHVLYQMQHYGMPTRLLDWTESLGAALFFAIEFSDEIEDPCIWVCDPFKLNKFGKKNGINVDGDNLYNPNFHFDKSYYESFVKLDAGKIQNIDIFDSPKALYPVKANDRIRAQKGVFTIHGKDILPLNKIVEDDKILKRFIINTEIIKEAKDYLETSGIDFFTIYPDFEGLAKHVNKYYFT